MFLQTRYLLCIFLTQILFAFVVYPIAGVKDFFPLYNWRLFAKVEKQRYIPMLTIQQIDAQVFPEPVNFYTFYKPMGRDFIAIMQGEIESLVEDYYNDPLIYQKKLKTFEEKYFYKNSFVRYQFLHLKVDQSDFYSNMKNNLETKVLGEFTFKK